MPFLSDKFQRAEFEPRQKSVSMEALADFFEGEPVWIVRGLNSNELHKAMMAKATQGSIESILKAIASTGDQAVAVQKVLGLDSDTPGEVAKRLEMLVAGSVDPQIQLVDAVKLAETFPIEFLTLTNEITELTGMGFEQVKPEAASQETVN